MVVVVASEFSATVFDDNIIFVGAAFGSATVPEIVAKPFAPDELVATIFTVRGKPSAP